MHSQLFTPDPLYDMSHVTQENNFKAVNNYFMAYWVLNTTAKCDHLQRNILRTTSNKPYLKFLYNIGLMMAVMAEISSQ
jgi:hypothetical protein